MEKFEATVETIERTVTGLKLEVVEKTKKPIRRRTSVMVPADTKVAVGDEIDVFIRNYTTKAGMKPS